MTFPLRALLGENMTTVRLGAFKAPGCCAAKTLGSTSIGFHLWHNNNSAFALTNINTTN
jgi:hypothetical protein